MVITSKKRSTPNQNGEIHIPVGHFALLNGSSRAVRISIYGLGSCIALFIYDSLKPICAMSHILLPKPKGKSSNPTQFPHKYADHSVKLLLEEMVNHNATRRNVRAIVVGGTDIFTTIGLGIGKANIREMDYQLGLIPIKVEKWIVGGGRGRIVIYDSTIRTLLVRTTGTNVFERIKLS